MELRPLGKTGLRVSLLGLGTVKLGRTAGLKYPGTQSPRELPTDHQAAELLQAAADLGINLLDTAPAYGASEDRLGQLMSRHDWFGGRDRWVLSTKAGEEFDPITATSSFDFSPRAIRASIERSLRRLRTDTLDVVLLHSDGNDDFVLHHSGALDALKDARRAGLIRALGASTKTLAGGLAAVALACDVVMVAANPADTSQLPAISAAADAGIGILIKKALASGHTTDIPAAIRFAAGLRGVSSIIIGTSSRDNLRNNVASLPSS